MIFFHTKTNLPDSYSIDSYYYYICIFSLDISGSQIFLKRNGRKQTISHETTNTAQYMYIGIPKKEKGNSFPRNVSECSKIFLHPGNLASNRDGCASASLFPGRVDPFFLGLYRSGGLRFRGC